MKPRTKQAIMERALGLLWANTEAYAYTSFVLGRLNRGDKNYEETERKMIMFRNKRNVLREVLCNHKKLAEEREHQAWQDAKARWSADFGELNKGAD